MSRIRLHCRDLRDGLPFLESDSMDGCLCDPPYGLGFMGKEWDRGVPGVEIWREVLRVLKPGASLLAFGGCYDGTTEVLTKRGWIAFPDATELDEFASLNLATELVEFQRPREMVRFRHDGPMHRYRNNRVDLLVTPNHRMLVAPLGRPLRDCRWALVPSEDVRSAVRMTKTSRGTAAAQREDFCLPGATRGRNQRGGGYKDLPEITIAAETWAAFLGLWLAEGHASSAASGRGGASTHIAVTHFNADNINAMAGMLSPYFRVCLYPKSGRLRINDPRLYRHLVTLGHAPDKHLPDYVKQWDPELLLILLDWYARGDGDSEGRIYTSSKKMADDLQEVAMYAGLAADITQRPPKDGRIKGRILRGMRPQFVVRLLPKQNKPEVYSRVGRMAVKTVVSAAEWNSREVFCVELPRHHTLYVRRNGKAVWCGNTRTYHRLACAIEDAGFEIRDSIGVPGLAWVHAQGFPKSLDISKAIDKAAGAERDRFAPNPNARADTRDPNSGFKRPWQADPNAAARWLSKPATTEAGRWDGYGTALKPAWESIVWAMAPLDGTYAENALKWGVAGLNVAGGRIGTSKDVPASPAKARENVAKGRERDRTGENPGADPTIGRWPANVILCHHPECQEAGTAEVRSDSHHPARRGRGGQYAGHTGQDGLRERHSGMETVVRWECHPDCPVAELDRQSGDLQSGFMAAGTQREGTGYRGGLGGSVRNDTRGDSGAASRFFYQAKVSPSERNGSKHPTLKPIDLSRYLAKLILPPARKDEPRRLLVPFAGEGSEIIGALTAGWEEVVGIEREEEYVAAAAKRIKATAPLIYQVDLSPTEATP